MIIKTKCINNKWNDFGNHTGFKEVERECSNLIVGDWYTLKYKNGIYTLLNQEKKYRSNINGFNIGLEFTTKDEVEYAVFEAYDFENFFLNKEQLRELKIKELLK